MNTEYKIICGYETKKISDCNNDELYSARAHAWVEFYDNKYDKPFNMPWCDFNDQLEALKNQTGINPIEDELRMRGFGLKPGSFNRVNAVFSRNQN